MAHLVIVLVLFEDKVQDAEGVHGGEPEAPIALYRLLLDGEGGVIDAAVLEEVLGGFLHLDDEARTVGGGAIEVEDGLAVHCGGP